MTQIVTTNFGTLEILPFQPSLPLVETLEHLTDVMLAVDGSEVRVPLRNLPRAKYDYKFPVKLLETPAIYNMFYSKLRGKFAIPIWSQAVGTLDAITIGGSSVVLNTEVEYFDYYSGGMAFIYLSNDNWEFVEIASIDTATNTLTTLNPMTKNWSSGAYVMPLRVGYVEDKVSRVTNGFSSIYNLSFEVIDNTVVAPIVPTQYKTFDVYTTEGLRPGGALNRDIISLVDLVDQDLGPVFKRTQWANSRYSYNHRIVLDNPSDIKNLKARFQRHMGKSREFWQPTFDVNLRIKAISGTMIDISSDDFIKYKKHEHIAIKKLDTGEWVFNKIVATSQLDPDTVRLTVDTTTTTPLSNIYYASYLGKCRLDSDTLQINHLGNGTIEAVFRIIEISPN